MADETPPLDDERLAEIRARAKVSWQMLENSETISVEVALTRDVLTLLAEVKRLAAEVIYWQFELSRSNEQRAEVVAERNRMGPLVRELATMPDTSTGYDGSRADCPWCEQTYAVGRPEIAHTPDCPVTKARQLLGL